MSATLVLTDQEAAVATVSAIATLKHIQAELTDSERIELWQLIQVSYCTDCGSKHLPCSCSNDI